MIGQTISHYRITGKLGEGGMGVVYRADDLSLDRQVALKVLPAQLSNVPEARARLLREAKAASALQHPNICSIHEIGTTDDGDMFMVMPCYEGESLRERLDRGALTVDEAIEIGRQIGSALSATHAKGILHRDIKPGNVMLTNDGSQAILMDFGLAKPDDATQITRTGAAVGTIAYMSPEQLRGEEVDSRSDLWSLGVVLYEMTTGQRPFNAGGEAGLFDSILHDDPVAASSLNQEVPAALAAMIDRMLTKAPAKRVADASTVTETLKAAKVLEAPFTWHARQWVRRNRKSIQTSLALLIAVAAFLIWQLWPTFDEIHGVAVLPFEDLSKQGDQEWFCNGMTDAVIHKLGEVGVPGVIARTSVERFRHTDLSISEIAHELDTDAVVEASILQIGDLVRVNARLFRGDTEEQLWADSFEREMKNVLQLHSEIARTIAEKIRIAINPDAGSDREVDPEAFRLYLRGRHWLNAYTDSLTLEHARERFEESAALDPTCAESWAGLAQWYVVSLHGDADPDENIPAARAALARAFEIEPDLQVAWSAKAHLAWEHDWNQEEAREAFDRALELNPSDAFTTILFAYFSMTHRQWDQAVDAALRAVKLDPFSYLVQSVAFGPVRRAGHYEEALELVDRARTKFPDDPEQIFANVRGWTLFLMGRHEEALQEMEEHPQEWVLHMRMLRELDRLDEARAVLRRAIDTQSPDSLQLAFAYSHIGEKQLALQHVADVDVTKTGDTLPVALVYLWNDEIDRCFEILEGAYEARNIWLPRINNRADFYDPLHADPRFQDLIERMGFSS